MRARLDAEGGSAQDDRMIEHKRKTFERALLYSYQAAKICKVEEKELGIEYRALINPDKINNDYDIKNLSVGFEYNYKCGDVLYWKNTDTYWLVYLKQFTEDAYFRAEIRRCKYQIQWVDNNKEKQSTWAYIRGPVEGNIDSVNIEKNSLDMPNYSLNIYIPNNEHNYKKFTRYSTFMFDGKTWEVQGTDHISADGIIEVIAKEYYTNTITSDVEENLTNAFEIRPILEKTSKDILAETIIKPTITYKYSYSDAEDRGTWSILEKVPVTLSKEPAAANIISLTWNELLSGQFTLVYTTSAGDKIEKTIIVDSLF